MNDSLHTYVEAKCVDVEALVTYIINMLQQDGLDPSKMSLKDTMGHQS